MAKLECSYRSLMAYRRQAPGWRPGRVRPGAGASWILPLFRHGARPCCSRRRPWSSHARTTVEKTMTTSHPGTKRLKAHALIHAATSATLSARSEEHTSELQSLMRISYAVFCLKKKKNNREIRLH